jgi:hypothetical protein
MPVAALRYFARQLTPLQGKTLLAAIVATIGGAGGRAYHLLAAGSENARSTEPEAWSQWISGHALGFGLSFVAAFVIAFFVRRFLFRALGIILLVLGAAAAVSYFSGINIDLSRARDAYDQSTGWISQQASALLELIQRHFGGAVAAGAGAFLGGRRAK